MKGLFALLALLATCGWATADTRMPTDPSRGFAPMVRMRALEGNWEGKVISHTPKGQTVPVWLEYETVSDGHAVMERLGFGIKTPESRKSAMVSMYHQETDQMMMTHFCAANTQPRMRTRAIPADLSAFQFFFVDSTNILNATMMNIKHVTLRFPGRDRLIQEWQAHGKEPPLILEVQRVR